MAHLLYRLRYFPPAERQNFAGAAICLPCRWIHQRLKGPSRVYSTSIRDRPLYGSCNESLTPGAWSTGSDQDSRDSLSEITLIRALVNIAPHHKLPRGGDLLRVIYLHSLLPYRAIHTSLKLCVRREHDQLLAHVCVECKGNIFNDNMDVLHWHLPCHVAFSTSN